MFMVNELYNSPTGQVFRCTAWDWKDRSWWFHPLNGEPSCRSGFWVSEDGRELGKGPSSPVLILEKKEDDVTLLNDKQRKFIEENQDLYNEILKKTPYEEIRNKIEEKDLTGLEWSSLEDFIEKIRAVIPPDASDISLFADSHEEEETVGVSWACAKKIQYTKSEREKMAFIKMQRTIREKEHEERARKLQQKTEEKERAEYERLKKKFERQ